jgi:hypothetical protein
MLAAALAQALVWLIAVIAGAGSEDPRWPWNVLALTGFFVALWLASAWLFQSAHRDIATMPHDGPRR